MRILITGCKGQLGTELIKQLNSFNGVYNLIEADMHNLDISNQKQVIVNGKCVIKDARVVEKY